MNFVVQRPPEMSILQNLKLHSHWTTPLSPSSQNLAGVTGPADSETGKMVGKHKLTKLQEAAET